VELLEERRVQTLEIRQRHRTEAAVAATRRVERVLRAAPVVEQRVIEIEKDGSYHGNLRAPHVKGPDGCVIH
jgi:hypothetical protein